MSGHMDVLSALAKRDIPKLTEVVMGALTAARVIAHSRQMRLPGSFLTEVLNLASVMLSKHISKGTRNVYPMIVISPGHVYPSHTNELTPRLHLYGIDSDGSTVADLVLNIEIVDYDEARIARTNTPSTKIAKWTRPDTSGRDRFADYLFPEFSGNRRFSDFINTEL